MNVAVVQMSSERDVEKNFETIERLVSDAVGRTAEWVVLPENAPFLGKDREKLAVAESVGGPMCERFSEIAHRHSIWLTVGSIPEKGTETHTFNTCVTFNPEGETLGVYRKMHLFDVAVDETTTFKESDSILAGDEIVTFEMGEFTVGVSICYDLRFPELYRKLVERGADVLIVPSAFTMNTGRDHWHALLKARAIENQCYVVAPDQFGNHFGTRWSFGQSAVYDPWGRLVACCSDGEGVAVTRLDPDLLAKTRAQIPCLDHRTIK